MDLKELMVDTKSAWFEFPGLGGFEIELVNLSRQKINSMRKKCVTTKFNRSSRVPEETFNEEKFVEEFSKESIKGWKGLKLKHLEELLPVDLGDNDKEAEMPYSPENAANLVKNSIEFDQWLNEVVFDLSNFRTNK